MTPPRNLSKLSVQNVSADYTGRSTAAIYSDYQHASLSGEMPHCAKYTARTNAPMKNDLEDLLPEGVKVTRRYLGGGKEVTFDVILAVNERLNILLERNSSQVVTEVSAVAPDEARQALLSVLEKVPTVKTPDHIIDAWVWYLAGNGPHSNLKKLVVPSWDEIKPNYIPDVITELEKMMAISRPQTTGKIILWHGPPGTGKTTALRALAREWKSWCNFHYISDPEKLFAEPEYLMEVGAPNADSGYDFDDDDDDEDNTSTKRKPNWRLVVAEDSDEFLRKDARNRAGAALGRLLNFSDGILGQGSNSLILLTTNEPLNELHKAVVRPGRCAAQIEFRKFSADQARAWGDNKFKVAGEMTLAEMIDKREGVAPQIATGIKNETVGQYL